MKLKRISAAILLGAILLSAGCWGGPGQAPLNGSHYQVGSDYQPPWNTSS